MNPSPLELSDVPTNSAATASVHSNPLAHNRNRAKRHGRCVRQGVRLDDADGKAVRPYSQSGRGINVQIQAARERVGIDQLQGTARFLQSRQGAVGIIEKLDSCQMPGRPACAIA